MAAFLKRYGIVLVLALSVALLVAYYSAHPQAASSASSIEGCISKGPYKEQCYEELIVEAARRNVSEALDLLSEIYSTDQQFASSCHGSTHELGKIAYERFSHDQDVALSEKTSYCGFGFFHGFLEGLFEASGDLAEARRFCEYVDEKLIGTLQGVSFACYHGIGHGVVDGTDPEKWGDASKYIAEGLALCDTLSDVEEHQERCASGVFNALAIAYVNTKYRLDNDPKKPFAICMRQEKRYAREACYDQMNGYISQTNPDFRDGLRVAATAESIYAPVAVKSLAAYTAQIALPKEGDLSEYVLDCAVLAGELGDECASGFGIGLIEFGNPGKEYIRAIEACKGGETLTDPCIQGVITSVRDRLPPATKQAFCRALRDEVSAAHGEKCDQMMGG